MAVVRMYKTGGPAALSGAGASSTPAPGVPAISWATVGFEADPDEPDATAAYWFIRGGQAYVECTLQPSGEQIVARVNMDGGYEVLSFGDRVVVMHANGDKQSSTIIGKLHDDEDPMPATVAGMPVEGAVFDPTTNARFARRVQFIAAKPGVVVAIESRGTGDVVLHAAAGVSIVGGSSVHVDAAQVVLGAAPATPAVPGEVIGEQETPAVPFAPALDSPVVYATEPPYTGILHGAVRAKDVLQSTVGLDPAFWAHLLAQHTFVTALATLNPVTIAAALTAYQAVPVPTTLTSRAVTASQRVSVRG